MKVESQKLHTNNDSPKKLSQEEIKAKIKAKFGKDLNDRPKPSKIDDKVELHSKGGVKSTSDEDFGDIGKNDPAHTMTQDKLKDILKTGAFSFNEKERKALSEILNK